MTDRITAEKVYSLIATEDIPRAAAINIIRSYGNRKAIEALEAARKSLPRETAWPLLEAEIETRLENCLRLLDEFLDTAMAAKTELAKQKDGILKEVD